MYVRVRVDLMLFSTHHNCPAALFESAQLAPRRARPLADNGTSFGGVFCSFLLLALIRLTLVSQLSGNPLALSFYGLENARPCFLELFSLTAHIGMIRERAANICFAMQDLELPAPLTLEIIDADCPNSIRMWAKWELITTIKHFHQRHD
jgi:hypothetical protein